MLTEFNKPRGSNGEYSFLTFESIADLRNSKPWFDNHLVYVKSYYANTFVGGGRFIGRFGTATDDSGMIIAGTGFYWSRQVDENVVTPEMFGYNASTTDATSSINMALASGYPISLKGGTYKVSKIIIPSNSTLLGSGLSYIEPLDTSSPVIDLGDSNSNITLSGIIFRDPSKVITSESALFINGTNISDITVENCQFNSMIARPIRLQNADNVRIIYNEFFGNRPHGSLSDERSSEIYLVDNIRNCLIENNKFTGNKTNLWLSREAAIFVHAVTAGMYWENVRILNNTIESYRRFGIGVGTQATSDLDQKSSGVWIERNFIRNSGQEGIKMKAGTKAFVNNNIIDGFELIMAEVPDSLNGGIFMQINPESTCHGNRIYGRNTRLWGGAGAMITTSTMTLPPSPTGTWDTAVISASEGSSVNQYVGKYVTIESGTGAGQWRRINSFNLSTKVATLNSAWTTSPDQSSIFAIYSNPSIGIKYRGNNSGNVTYTDSRTARVFQSKDNYVEGCEVGYGFSEPLINCDFGSLHAEDCRAILKSYTGTLKNSRGIKIYGLSGNYYTYPSTDNSSSVTISDFEQVEIYGLDIHSSYYDGLRLTNVDNFKIFGGVVEGCGSGVTGRYGLAIAGNVSNFESHGVTYGGKNAGAGQSYAAFFQGTNTSIKFIGGDMTGNVTGPFNNGSSGSLLPPRDTVLIGVKGIGQLKGSIALTDANKTLIVGTDPDTVILNVPLTANRTVSFSTSFIEDGAVFNIVRTANATGSFSLSINGLTTKTLAAGTSCVATYSSSLAAWVITDYSSL